MTVPIGKVVLAVFFVKSVQFYIRHIGKSGSYKAQTLGAQFAIPWITNKFGLSLKIIGRGAAWSRLSRLKKNGTWY